MNAVVTFVLSVAIVLVLGLVVEFALAAWRWRRSGRWRWPMTAAGGLTVAGFAANLAALDLGGRPVTTPSATADSLSLGREAEEHFRRGHHDTTLALCDRMNAKHPNCALAHHLRGLVYEARGRTDDARTEYLTAARHNYLPSVARLRRFD